MNSDLAPLAVSRSARVERRGVAVRTALVWLGCALAWACADAAAADNVLVDQTDAARLGLERAWFAQIPVDAARSRVTNWHLDFDRLYGVSDSGVISALDAETGATLWTKRVGPPDFPLLGPGANAEYVGVVSGSRLYLLDRQDGRLQWSRVLGSAPSSGPALTESYAFIALVTGRIEGYRLDDPETQPWYYQSKGRTYLRPTTTGRVVSWPTAAGYLYVSRANPPGVLFRLETKDDIVTSPAQQAPYLYIASLDGNLYSMHETTGVEQWRYPTGYPIASSPAIVDKQAYVASLEPMLHAIDAATGRGLWRAAGVSHFAAQGAERVYASDRYGNLLVLDAKTGLPQGELKTAQGLYTLVNDQSDRIFLVSDRGLVQCLREIGADEPTTYRRSPAEEAAAEAEAAASGEEAPAEATPSAESAEAAEEPVADVDVDAEALEETEEALDEGEAAEEPADVPVEEFEDNPFD